MLFKDLPVDIQCFYLRAVGEPPSFRTGEPLPVRKVKPSSSAVDVFDVFVGEQIVRAVAIQQGASIRLKDELSIERSYLAQIEPLGREGDFELRIAFFFQRKAVIGDIEVAVDEYVVDRFKELNRTRAGKSLEQICAQMKYDFVYNHDGENYFFVIAGSALDNELDMAEEAEYRRRAKKRKTRTKSDLVEEMPKANNMSESGKSFGVMGRDAFFAATQKSVDGIGNVFVASKMTRRENRAGRNIRLALGSISFSDMTRTGAVADAARLQVEAMSRENSTYLKKWDEYGDEEGNFLLARARRYGVLYYASAEQGYDGTTTVQIVESSSPIAFSELAVNGIESVELVKEVPSYLADPEMTFEQFTKELMEKDRAQRMANLPREETVRYDVKSFNDGSNKLILKTDGLPSDSGKLILSIGGEVTQIKRRVEARRRIRNCDSANPQLALILEPGQPISRAIRPLGAKVALNAFVERKIFPRNRPTGSQREAIEIALNTPDIALIQGPPGTGKTTVIAAIVERLNQICAEKGVTVRGQVLLTGYQHDAVENMIGRMSINGIPCIPKFGKSSSDRDEGKSNIYESTLETWCQEIAENIREKYPKLDEAGRSTEVQMLALQYSQAPSQKLALDLVTAIADAPVAITGASLRERARKERSVLKSRQEIVAADTALEKIRLLRVKKESFLDDGPDRAEDVLDSLYSLLEPSERKFLSKVSAYNTSLGEPPFMGELVKLKARLLERLSKPPEFHVDKPNETVLSLAEEFIEASRNARLSAADEKLRVLSEFVTDLENNHYGMVDAISEYSFAFAATCQHSSSKMVADAKAAASQNGGDEGLVYEYVIVDEAARVTPRDLMIPMAQGKRIILVGDHRQLPHIVDTQVEDAIKHGGGDMADLEWLENSMFEQLFTKRMPELYERDGIKRCVTLDSQFRMHPLLGKFISRNFYERYSNGTESIKSPLGAEHYAHNLPGLDNKPLAWIEVPRGRGKERPNEKKSLFRDSEADAIISQLDEWMSTEEGQKLTYGIISFYRGQADYIEKRLGDRADGARIRVGTVDSFQGMEFDVVFLSMVRTLPDSERTHELGLIETIEEIEAVVPSSGPEQTAAEKKSLLARFGRNRRNETGPTFPAREKRVVVSRKYEPRPIVSPSNDPQEVIQARRLFGFLTNYKRLNVSMSRQKKLLVVVGDSNLLKTDLADKYIPGLVDFYLLCSAEGVFL